MALLDANIKRVKADVQRLPLSEAAKLALRDVVLAGADKLEIREAMSKNAPAEKPAEKKEEKKEEKK